LIQTGGRGVRRAASVTGVPRDSYIRGFFRIFFARKGSNGLGRMTYWNKKPRLWPYDPDRLRRSGDPPVLSCHGEEERFILGIRTGI
jgi:hypothetical protein